MMNYQEQKFHLKSRDKKKKIKCYYSHSKLETN